ncbi:MAG: ABC transporter substrate-binding protein, partial [Microvirga sp.]
MTLSAATSGLSRRDLLAALAAAPLALHRGAWSQDGQPLKICQSTALSGPLGDLGQALHHGAKAGFAEANAKGGVHGRKIELSVLDDGYDAKRALANLDTFLADRDSFALFNWFGTPIVAATLPKVIESGLPFLAPYTGALLARPKDVRNVFNIRA